MIRNLFFVAMAVIILIPLLLLLGLQIQPRPFPTYPQTTPELDLVPLPDDLPAPVARYYEAIMGEQVPVIESAVISTRGKLRFAGIPFPMRFRFTHDAGQGYRHYIEAAVFGFPLLKVNERYLDGQARMELPVGVIEHEPKVDMAANLGLWGESVWLPSIFITDPRVRWEGIDETTARLIVPFEEGEDSFTVFFDVETNLVKRMEAMRYKDAADTQKTLWVLDPRGWREFHGILVPSPATVTWGDEDVPWLEINLEEVAYNVNVSNTIRARGP